MEKIYVIPQVPLEPKKAKFCRCSYVTVDEARREVLCRECGRKIDPFDFLFDQAKKQANALAWVKKLYKDQASIQKDIEELKRQRRNLKAQVDRFERKLVRK